jgi:hypothetical protein
MASEGLIGGRSCLGTEIFGSSHVQTCFFLAFDFRDIIGASDVRREKTLIGLDV